MGTTYMKSVGTKLPRLVPSLSLQCLVIPLPTTLISFHTIMTKDCQIQNIHQTIGTILQETLMKTVRSFIKVICSSRYGLNLIPKNKANLMLTSLFSFFKGQFQDQRLETAMVCPGFDETSIAILRYARRLSLQRSH